MSKLMTSSQLIKSIKRRASIPENQSTFTAEDLLEFATEELLLGVVPAIMSVHEDYFLFEERVPLVHNKSEYKIPGRALGNKLRDVQWAHDNDHLSELTRIGIGERFNEYDVRTETNLRSFYIKNNKVVLSNSQLNNPSGELAFIYYIRPSSLVSEDRVGVIQGINDLGNGTTEIIVNNIPDNFNTNIKYDFYKSESPSAILSIDLIPTAISVATNSIAFPTTSIPDDLEIGDHLAQACEAIIPQIPSELHSMLAQMVACRVLESMGDTQGLQNALVKLQQMENAAGMLVDNRIDDAPQKIVNRHGLVRTAVFSKRFNRR